MKTFKRLFFSTILFALFVMESCNSHAPANKYILKGTISGIADEKIILQETDILTGGKREAQIDVKNGKFEFEGMLDSLPVKLVVLSKPNPTVKPIVILVDNNVISIKGVNEKFGESTIEGSELSQKSMEYMLSVKQVYREKFVSIANEIEKAKYLNQKRVVDSLQNIATKIAEDERKASYDFILNDEGSLLGASILLSEFLTKPDIDKCEKIYTKLPKNVKDGKFGLEIRHQLDIAKLTSIGNTAPDFLVQNQYGTAIKLSSFCKENNYTLLDFWASWCAPCRLTVPELLKTYQTFKPKGFSVLAISLDTRADKWTEAVKNDKLEDWTHSCDLLGWNSPLSNQYHIKAIPANFLIDKNGKIVAKDLSPTELTTKLHELGL